MNERDANAAQAKDGLLVVGLLILIAVVGVCSYTVDGRSERQWKSIAKPTQVSQQSSALDHCISAYKVIMFKANDYERDYVKDGYPVEIARDMALERSLGLYSRNVGVSVDILVECAYLLEANGIPYDSLVP